MIDVRCAVRDAHVLCLKLLHQPAKQAKKVVIGPDLEYLIDRDYEVPRTSA